MSSKLSSAMSLANQYHSIALMIHGVAAARKGHYRFIRPLTAQEEAFFLAYRRELRAFAICKGYTGSANSLESGDWWNENRRTPNVGIHRDNDTLYIICW